MKNSSTMLIAQTVKDYLGTNHYLGYERDLLNEILNAIQVNDSKQLEWFSQFGDTLYSNDGYQVRRLTAFEPDYLFSFFNIQNGNIFIKKLEYSDDDPRCCPSLEVEHQLKISGDIAY